MSDKHTVNSTTHDIDTKTLLRIIKYFLLSAGGDVMPTYADIDDVDKKWELCAEDVDGLKTHIFLVERAADCVKHKIEFVDAQGTFIAQQITQVTNPELLN